MSFALIMLFVIEMVRGLRASDVIAKSWGESIIAAVIFVIKMVRRVRVSGGIAPSGRERRKTSSKPVAIPLLMTVTRLIVVKVMRGLRGFGTTTTFRKELGKIPLLLLAVMLVLEVVRGLRVRDPVTTPLLDGIGGRRRDKPH